MYELIRVGAQSHYLQSPAKIGLVALEGGEVCLIDSGNDKDAGRKVRQQLDANGWKLRAIYNTHSNADHVGGNEYLQKQTGCRIYAPGIESAFTRWPILEPSYLYGGFPPKDLRHKFLMAKPSGAEALTDAVLPEGFEKIPLPGHFFDMVGFRLSSRETLEKYKIGVLYDVAAYLDTLERVKQLEAPCFVPAHADATEDIAPLAQYNIDRVHEVADRILALCAEPRGPEELLQRLFTDYGLTMDFSQYVLVGSTVRSYLAWLRDSGLVEPRFEQGRMLWARL